MRIDKIFGFGVLMIAPALGNAQASDDHPTYANEVSRIIQDNCQICHQPGAIGPMSFTSYEEVRPWAPLIQLKVKSRDMPPYQYDRDTGVQELKNDWRLSQEDIDTIVAWVNAGSPLGNPEELPPPREFPRSSSTVGRFASAGVQQDAARALYRRGYPGQPLPAALRADCERRAAQV